MPFSSLHDPIDIARAHGAFDAAWSMLAPELGPGEREHERNRLADIITALSAVAVSEKDLVERAIKRFRENAGTH